ncbi:MAG: hypothetical protein IJ323_07150 [Clostridia bacterium]|nr:hypothetical protein [Clostridia bacterium]
MDFKKKLKTRLWIALIYVALGIIMTAGGIVTKTDNSFISSFGLILAVMGAVRMRNYLIITKSEERIKKQEIMETDERNVSIVNKARSITFTAYVLLLGIAVIVLSLLNMREIAVWISYSIFLLIIIYWISYFIIRKKS